jgi:hypothetical protein
MIDVASMPRVAPPKAFELIGHQPPDTAKLGGKDSPELRKAFDDFVGQSFFSQVLSQMRKTVDKPAYFHGGLGEELFQGQLDQVMVEELSNASARSFSEPMYELFMLGRG